MATATIWGCLSSQTNCECHILHEVDVELRGPFKARLPYVFEFQDVPLLIWRPQSSSILKYAEVINTKHTKLTFQLTEM